MTKNCSGIVTSTSFSLLKAFGFILKYKENLIANKKKYCI